MLLNSLNFPKDLKNLSTLELEQLAGEIRALLLQVGDKVGGHLASNLGVVEMTIALHTVLDSPKDKILWDTSHQCYVHKILTGRLDQIFTIRQDGGLSGFAKITESEHDIFGAGHACTALSAAVGVAHARDLNKEKGAVFAVIGDATLSGGMAFEALNNAERLKNSNLVCILNDNDMSISRPVGQMANYITQLRTSQPYNRAKRKFERIMERIPRIGVPLKNRIEKAVDRFRDIVFDAKMGVIFEEFGFRYIGPIDGHNIPLLVAAFKYAQSYNGPIMIHCITTKGKGHLPAEQDPIKHHGVSPKSTSAPAVVPSFTDVFGNEICELGKKDSKIVVVTPAMKVGSGLTKFADQFPDRFFDVGMAEEHAVTFCAGLARNGVKPILAIYSTFLQRGFDQLIHDVCIQKLPVIFALDRAGIVGGDGQTHQGTFDYAYLLPVPHVTILAPKDGEELKAMLNWAVTHSEAVTIRYPKDGMSEKNGLIQTPMTLASAEVMLEASGGCLLIASGTMAWTAYEVAGQLDALGIACSVINLRFIKPLDVELIRRFVDQSEHVFVIEEGSAIGGVFGHILQSLPECEKPLSQWHQIALPDEFIEHGKISSLKEKYHLSASRIFQAVLKKIQIPVPQ